MDVKLRPVGPGDQPDLDRWAQVVAGCMSRTRPRAEGADRHDPGAGLHWHIIVRDGLDVGTVWIEHGPGDAEAVLGIYLGDPAFFGHGIGAAAVRLAVAEFRAARPDLPVVLRVRRANTRAVACYRRAGFEHAGEGIKTAPSGEQIPCYRMVHRF